jgi:hypothetical protein
MLLKPSKHYNCCVEGNNQLFASTLNVINPAKPK